MFMQFKLGVIYPKHKGTMVLRNMVKYEQRHRATPHETISSARPLWEPQISYYFILLLILDIQGDSGGIFTTLENDSMSDSKQKSS